MSDWLPSATIADLQKRAQILTSIRAFFSARSVVEVDTPILSASGLTCPEIESFTVQPFGNLDRTGNTGYLHTSPEFPMKRLLAAGIGDCYQLCHVFRAEESGRRHNPEFMLLEWYRLGWHSQQLMDEVAELIQSLFQAFAPERAPREIQHCRYEALFEQVLSINPFTASLDLLRESAQVSVGEQSISAQQWTEYDRDDWLNYLMAMAIEPSLAPEVLTFVTHYPQSQAALARVDPDDPRTALRFECYLGGLELANGFDELTDADEQLARFTAENVARLEAGQAAMPIDYRLIAALGQLPQTSGVALGVDRLIMLLLGKATIGEVMAFPQNLA